MSATRSRSSSTVAIAHTRRRTGTAAIPTIFSTLRSLCKRWLRWSHGFIWRWLHTHWRRTRRRRLLARWSTHHLRLLRLIEASQLWYLALRVLAIDLDCARDEELLFLSRPSLPVVWLGDSDCEPHRPCPLSMLRFFLTLRRQRAAREGFNGRQLFQIPGLANAEAPIIVLTRLVHPHSAGRAHGNYDQTWLLRI